MFIYINTNPCNDNDKEEQQQ